MTKLASPYKAVSSGMSFREYVAVAVMRGMWANPDYWEHYTAENAVKKADALIAELSK